MEAYVVQNTSTGGFLAFYELGEWWPKKPELAELYSTFDQAQDAAYLHHDCVVRKVCISAYLVEDNDA